MHDSDTYLAILDEGALKQMRKVVLRLGQRRLGSASEDVVTAIMGIDDLERLNRLLDKTLEVSNWQELLELP